MAHPFFTVGHSNRSVEELAELLRAGGAQLVVDVRTVPRSRYNPQFNADALGESLAPWQIGYTRIAELGGLRGRSHEVAPELNGWWDNKSFHNYADYALSAPFRRGLGELIGHGRERPTAVMCAEAVWWRCHRRIIADYLIARGESVFHLMAAGRAEPARLTEGARVEDETITYPPPLL
jgi:uncharacterized protein (DUF488 family)